MFTLQEATPVSILIIDDMASNIKVLLNAVDGLAEVFFASSGSSGLARAGAGAPGPGRCGRAPPAFVSYWDDQHLNRFCNDVAGRWFGVPAASMAGMALPEVVAVVVSEIT